MPTPRAWYYPRTTTISPQGPEYTGEIHIHDFSFSSLPPVTLLCRDRESGSPWEFGECTWTLPCGAVLAVQEQGSIRPPSLSLSLSLSLSAELPPFFFSSHYHHCYW